MEESVELDFKSMQALAGPFPAEAFAFLQHGLRHTIETLDRTEADLDEEERHVSGPELCLGLRDYAIRQYGRLARTVLAHWHISSTEDFGKIVFAMVQSGLMRQSEDDRLEDFQGVYEFDEVFEEPTVTAAD